MSEGLTNHIQLWDFQSLIVAVRQASDVITLYTVFVSIRQHTSIYVNSTSSSTASDVITL
jgi:hypothetical protein